MLKAPPACGIHYNPKLPKKKDVFAFLLGKRLHISDDSDNIYPLRIQK
jgi:hypothetical protein